MTRDKDRFKHDRKEIKKLTLSNGVRLPDAELFVTPPRDWEGFIDRKSKGRKLPIVWETSVMNIPEMVKVIEAKGLKA